MDFALLPPEINSGRMYSGPGAGPMLAAATAWDGLATDLYSAAASYQSVISGLTVGPWLGPSSVTMAAAAAPYVGWLSATAAQAEQTAMQARAAAAAHEAAFAMTVPPPVIAANRSLLMALVATNFFGQNTPAIAATEVQYAEMWAQDATAMYGYAGASSAASTLTPFSPPPVTTNVAGLADQAIALAQNVGQSALGSTLESVSALNQLATAVPPALEGLASPNPSLSGLSNLLTLGVSPSSVNALSTASLPLRIATTPLTYLGAANSGLNIGRTIGTVEGVRDQLLGVGLGSVLGGTVGPGPLQSILGGLGVGASHSVVSAGVGQAASIGGLSVPQSWAAVSPAAVSSPLADASAASAVAASGSGTPWPEMAMAGLAGRAVGGVSSRARRTVSAVGRSPGKPSVEADELAAAHKRIAQLEAELASTRDACERFNAEAVVPPKCRRAVAEGLIARRHSPGRLAG